MEKIEYGSGKIPQEIRESIERIRIYEIMGNYKGVIDVARATGDWKTFREYKLVAEAAGLFSGPAF